MQVKEIDINIGKIKRYGICKKKVQNLIFRWSYHSDLLYACFSWTPRWDRAPLQPFRETRLGSTKRAEAHWGRGGG